MKNHRLTVLAALLCCSVSALANESPTRKIVLKCSPNHQSTMTEVRRAIQFSDYTVSLHARLEMLARMRATCATRPTAVLTFVSPDEMSNAPYAEFAKK